MYPENEDSQVSYGAIAAKQLGADLHLISWTGEGLVRNSSGSTSNTLPQLWLRWVADNSTYSWNFNNFIPQVVVINLGTNDYAQGDPGAAYEAGYETLINNIRTYYGPSTYIFCAVSPMMSGSPLASELAHIQNVVSYFQSRGDGRIALIDLSKASVIQNTGCISHPNAATHAAVGQMLSSAIANAMHWTSTTGNAMVGGQVLGLNGSVTLSYNNAAQQTISTSGGFIFNDLFMAGQSYDVTVVNQPNNQTCMVLNGVGTVGSGNVNNVYVVCSNNLALGGIAYVPVNAVQPLTLRNLNNNDVVLSNNGNFVFSQPLAPGGNFNIQVMLAPGNGTCTVDSAHKVGVMGSTSDYGMVVDCGLTLYTVTAAVTGLAGGNGAVMLTDQTTVSTDFANATQNGNYTFSTALSVNESYNVAVLQSPSNVSCQALNGSGTISNANVTVAVQCTTYLAVTGTVQNQAVNTNLLLINAPDTLWVTANNPNFAFPTPYVAGTLPAPSVQLQPSGQSCTVNTAAPSPNSPNSVATVSCQNRAANTYAVGGSVSGLAFGTALQLRNGADTLVSTNGPFSFTTGVANNGSYAVTVGTQPKGQRCTVAAGTGTVSASDVSGITVTCAPLLNFSMGQGAAVVIGQNGFGTGSVNAGTAFPFAGGLSGGGAASLYTPTGALFIADPNNNRLLGYPAIPTKPGSGATYVVGQADATSNSASTSPSGLNGPSSISSNGNTVIIVDTRNNRVLLSQGSPASGYVASTVVGQTNFTTATSGCSPTKLSAPRDAAIVGNTLWVSDTNNNRLLAFTPVPTSNGAAATLVLGQGTLATCAANGPGAGNPNANTLSSPSGMWSDGVRLVVADTGNHRALVWPNIVGLANNAPATYVVGQTSLATAGIYGSAGGLYTPQDVTSDGNSLFIADSSYNRVTIYPFPTANAAQAIIVLGQSSTGSGYCNQGAAAPTAATLCGPTGVSIVGSALLVGDAANNRYLIYNSN